MLGLIRLNQERPYSILIQSVLIFSQVNYLYIALTFTKTLLFYWFQSDLQVPQNNSSLCIPPLRQYSAQLRTLIYILKPPPFLPCLQLFWLDMSMTIQSKTCLISTNNTLTKYTKKLTTMMRFLTINIKYRLISNWRHFSYQSIPRFSKKQPIFFNIKSLKKKIMSINLPHHMKSALKI